MSLRKSPICSATLLTVLPITNPWARPFGRGTRSARRLDRKFAEPGMLLKTGDLEMNGGYRRFGKNPVGRSVRLRGDKPDGSGASDSLITITMAGPPDLFIANGHLSPEIDPYHIDTTYAQRKLLYHNVPSPAGGRTFADVSTSSGPGIELVSSSRGVAFADYRNDGNADIAINNMNGPAFLLRNAEGTGPY